MRRRARSIGLGVGAAVGALVVGLACSPFAAQDDDTPASASDAAPIPDGPGGDGDDAATCDPGTTASDPANCGRCGHDCLGGRCTDGKCEPVELGSVASAPAIHLALDATRALWLTSESPSGGAPGALYACPKAGCLGGSPTPLAIGALAGHTQILQTSLRPDDLYAAAFDEPANQARSIYLWPRSGDATLVGTFGVAGVNTVPMVVAGGKLFLGAIDTNKIESCVLPSCDASWNVFATASTTSMASDEQTLFWISAAGSLDGCPIAGKCDSIQRILSGAQLGGARAVSVTASSGALFVVTDGGDLFACEPASCASTVERVAHESALHTSVPTGGRVVAADDRAIYYVAVDGAEGGTSASRVMKVAR